MNIEKALKDNRIMKAITGMTKEEFNNLKIVFEKELIIEQKSKKENRKREIGGGRKHTLARVEAKLFFILIYVKCYMTFDLLGIQFNVDRAQTNRWVHRYLPILEKALGRAIVLPARKIRSMEEFIRLYPEIQDIFIDGIERAIERPKNKKLQKKYYSGKKKRHMKKNIIISDEKRRILFIGKTKGGRIHDKKLLEKENIIGHIPTGVTIWQDLGFKGIEKLYPDKQIMIPHKRSKNKELTEEQKEENRIIRVVVEHGISGIKRMKSISDKYRNKKPKTEDRLMIIAAGLWNYHLMMSA